MTRRTSRSTPGGSALSNRSVSTPPLSAIFPEVAAFTEPGDEVLFEYDQRVAMENGYDYGYTDVSIDGGSTWETALVVDNPGFAGTPGSSWDWSAWGPQTPGHAVIDLSEYAGQELGIAGIVLGDDVERGYHSRDRAEQTEQGGHGGDDEDGGAEPLDKGHFVENRLRDDVFEMGPVAL